MRLDPTVGALRIAVQGGSITGDTDISDNLWHHVAAVLDNDGSPDVSEVKLYVNGIEESYSSVSGQAINTAAVDDVIIGAINNTGYFDGKIDDVRIYDKALSVGEIQQLYNTFSDCSYDGIVNLVDFTLLADKWLSCGWLPTDVCP